MAYAFILETWRDDMFTIKNKLSPNLKDTLKDNIYKNYRVIISCNTLLEKVKKKVLSYKGEIIYTFENLNCICASLNKRGIERLTEYPEVHYIDFDSLVFSIPFDSSTNDVTDKMSSKSLSLMNDKNNSALNGKDVCIGIISTGIYPNNDLVKPNNRIVKSIDFTENYSYPYDNVGLGTFIAGIIGGNGYSSKGLVKGVAPRCNFYSVKVFDIRGRAFASTILQSMYSLANDALEYKIKVLFLPFETFEYNKFILSLFQKTFDYISNMGITIIIPTGSSINDPHSIRGIASLDNCICIGGLNSVNPPSLYKYSSSGPYPKKKKPDFVFKCYKLSTLNFNKNYIPERNGMKLYAPPMKYAYAQVSSVALAGAYACGLCALLYEHKEDLTYKDIHSILKLSSNSLELPKTHIGYGTISLENLVLPKVPTKE